MMSYFRVNVSLPEILEAREKRAYQRQCCFRSVGAKCSLLQITVNIPGTVKNSPMVRNIYIEALNTVDKTFPLAKLLPESSDKKKTGPVGYFLLPFPGEEVKRKTSFLEDNHILGRLWDLDIFTDPDHQVSRSDLDLERRLCYLCSRPAHECSRSRRHSLEEINLHIKELYQQFLTQVPSMQVYSGPNDI